MDANSESLSGGLPPDLYEQRHLPVRQNKAGRRISYNHFVRQGAKRLAESDFQVPCSIDRLECRPHFVPFAICPDIDRSRRRPRIERHLKERHWQELPYSDGPVRRISWTSEEQEGRDLAHSEIALPSDRSRQLKRPPSLEREDAFRDASSSKGKVRVRRMLSDDAEVAELYRIGLLYDEEQPDSDDIFNLNCIRRDAPDFSIRPSKRARKTHRASHAASDVQRPRLHLNLSFTDLGPYDDIAHHIFSPPASETSGDEDIQHTPRQSPQSFPPLRIIYELAGSDSSFDVETTQTPDLVLDNLSDYDYFSDGELDIDSDMPSQREIYDGSDPWIILGDGS